MYTISNEAFEALFKTIKPHDELSEIPQDLLGSKFKTRIKAIIDRIALQAKIPKTILSFVTGETAKSDFNGHVYFGTGFAKQSDGAIAAIMGHELAHVVLQHQKRDFEKFMTEMGYSDHVTDVETVKHQVKKLDPFLGRLTQNMLNLDNYKTNEGEADETGIKYALAAGYPKDEITNMAD